ncbi:hypothetical protein GCM10010464_27140 [Pseudonocardia yunnanensis]
MSGTAPGAYLRAQPLLAARAMLSDPRYARLGISDIWADESGHDGHRKKNRVRDVHPTQIVKMR